MVLKHAANTRDPFAARHPWYALLEISGLKADGTAERLLTGLLETATERELIIDATIASSLGQQKDFWRLREVLLGVAEARGRQHQDRRLRADAEDPRVHRPRRRRRGRHQQGRAARAAEPLRRRQRALQHQPAGRHGPRAASWSSGRRSRAPCTPSCWSSAARSRPSTASASHEARRARPRQGPRRAGPDAPDQGRASTPRASSIRGRCCECHPGACRRDPAINERQSKLMDGYRGQAPV